MPTPAIKRRVYSQSKTERKLFGPAAYNYPTPAGFAVESCRVALNTDYWQRVDLPHDYIVQQDLYEEENNALGYFRYQNAWYRKKFTLPENSEGKRVTLRFDGIAVHSTVYLNGCLMYHNFSAYNTFEVDISNNVYYDKENVLAVYVNTDEFEGWWYRGGGIYRDVHLTITEPPAIDLFLQKKGAFYLNRALWTEEPMVHIVSHWNFRGLEGTDRFVPVYTNCDAVELFLNGQSLGKQTIEKYGHGEWHVPYAPGILVAVGYKDGQQVCSDQQETTGRAVSLKLTMVTEPFEANGTDMALFTCECCDEQGRIVPDAAAFVRFVVSEGAQVVATGSDTSDHIRVNLPQRKMYMGKIAVAVRPQSGCGHYTLTAISEDCGAASITV